MAIPLGASFKEARVGSSVPLELYIALERNDFFSGVSGSLVHEVAAGFRMALLPAGALLYGRKSLATRIFLILEGAVQLEYPNGGKQIIGETLYNGQFTGEPSLMLDHEPLHRVTAKCVEPTLLCWTRAVELKALLGREPQIALNVAYSLHLRVVSALAALDEL